MRRKRRQLYRQAKAPEALLDCRVGRMMVARGLAHEVEFGLAGAMRSR